jgi:CHAT domain-containing protein
VHFGTHGVFNGEHAELSGIILSLYSEQGEPQAGFLGLHEVYNLNLPVELVVLSACNTAVGKEIRGEGLVGLTRGFMYAGATGVIASLWKVDDDATAELMKDFYSALLQEGLSPSAALRKAQIKMWQVDRRRSPYYWAAFVFQGEYQPASRFTEVKRGHIVGAAVAILLASIIAWYGVRRNALFFTKR